MTRADPALRVNRQDDVSRRWQRAGSRAAQRISGVGHGLRHLVQAGSLPRGAVRPDLLELVRPEPRPSPRVSSSWDEGAAREYITHWSRQPLPVVEGPLVSVVMPVRNRPDQVRAAVASVLAQTLTDWELLLVDDGSDDGRTPPVVAELGRADPRIRAIHLAASGVSAARNAGLAQGRGEYVAFLDSDNVWAPDFLRIAVAAIWAKGLRSGFAVAIERGESRPRYRTFAGTPADLLAGNFIDLNVLVIRRDLLDQVGHFDPQLRRMVDYDLVLRIAAEEVPVFLPFVGVEYSAAPDATRISRAEPLAWEDLVRTRRLVDWGQLASDVKLRNRAVSVITVVGEDWRAGLRTLDSMRAALSAETAEFLLVGDGGCAASRRLLATSIAGQDRTRMVQPPVRLHYCGAVDYAFAQSTGDVILVAPTGLQHVADLSAEIARVRSESVTLVAAGRGVEFLVSTVENFIELSGLDPLFVDEWGTADLARRLCARGRSVDLSAVIGQVGPGPDTCGRTDNLQVWQARYGRAEPGTSGLVA